MKKVKNIYFILNEGPLHYEISMAGTWTHWTVTTDILQEDHLAHEG
jgi:hypothetical protein